MRFATAALAAALLFSGSCWAQTPSQLVALTGCQPYPTFAGGNLGANLGAFIATGGTAHYNSFQASYCKALGSSLTEDGTTGGHNLSALSLLSVTSGTYTCSAYVKNIVGTRGAGLTCWSVSFGSEASVSYNPATCANLVAAAATTNFSAPSSSCVLVSLYGSTMAKISLTFTTSATDTGFNYIFYNETASSLSFAGDSSSTNGWWRPCVARAATC